MKWPVQSISHQFNQYGQEVITAATSRHPFLDSEVRRAKEESNKSI